jgi:hypothetical protein
VVLKCIVDVANYNVCPISQGCGNADKCCDAQPKINWGKQEVEVKSSESKQPK